MKIIGTFIWLLLSAGALFAQSSDMEWTLVHHEEFNNAFPEPADWIEDRYGDTSRWHVDLFDEDGDFFRDQFGSSFDSALKQFRSFRKTFTYGEQDWLTIELYGRDEDQDGEPESGGTWINENGKARLISTRHTDAAIIRSTEELPEYYRIELTVSNVDFGGDPDNDGDWVENGKFNGYDGDELAGPWRKNADQSDWLESWHENGLYYLCITDYPAPAPHNNVFIHHHRKVVMDTDNNNYDGTAWSYVYNPGSFIFEEDGSLYANMVWLNGEDFGTDFTGNHFTSWTPAGWQTEAWNANFADKFLPEASYTYTIERTPGGFGLSISGHFYYGGETTYTGFRKADEFPVVWHYNREEPYEGSKNQVREYYGQSFDTWPSESYYPEYFFCGDPHINFYEGSADFDDIKLWEGEKSTGTGNAGNMTGFQLECYPNPFHRFTNIQYTITRPGRAGIYVYEITGKKVAVLTDEMHLPGDHHLSWDASDHPPGIYLIRLQTEAYSVCKSIIVQ